MSKFKVNHITSKSSKNGPVLAGITTVSSTGAMRISSGNTNYRLIKPESNENIVRDQLYALYDAGRMESFGNHGMDWFDISGNNRHMPVARGVSDSNSNTTRACALDYNNGGGIIIGPAHTWWRSNWKSRYDFSVGVQGKYQELTVEMWYKVPSSTDRMHLWEFGDSNNNDYSNMQMNLNDGRAIWVYTDNGSPYNAFGGSDGAYTDGTIRNLTYTYNVGDKNSGGLNGQGLAYMNGSLISGLTHSGDQQWRIGLGGVTGWFCIGADEGGGSIAMIEGSIIYKVAVYTKTLTAAEVLQNYNALSYRYS